MRSFFQGALVTAFIGLAAITTAAIAQSPRERLAQGSGSGAGSGAGSGSGQAMTPAADAAPSSKAFAAINAKMHKDMAIAFSGDADVDFVRGMIPHHEGAVEMAKVLLAHGKDPALRKLGEEIVKAQESEITLMKAWLAKQGK